MRNPSLLVLFVSAVTAASAAGPDAKYKAPRAENGQPDMQGVWNFNSDVPLERPASAADKNVWTREELEAQKAATARAFDLISKVAPVEAVGLDWLDNAGRIENLRTSLITYPENGRVPKLVEGVRRVPGPEQIFAALAGANGAPPAALLSAFLGGGKKEGPEDLPPSNRCLLGGGTPLMPGFDQRLLHTRPCRIASAYSVCRSATLGSMSRSIVLTLQRRAARARSESPGRVIEPSPA